MWVELKERYFSALKVHDMIFNHFLVALPALLYPCKTKVHPILSLKVIFSMVE